MGEWESSLGLLDLYLAQESQVKFLSTDSVEEFLCGLAKLLTKL